MRRQLRRLLTTAVAVLVLAGTNPVRAAETPSTQSALGELPDDCDFALCFGGLRPMLTQIDAVLQKIIAQSPETAQGIVSVRMMMPMMIGFDPLNAATYGNVGLDVDQPITVATKVPDGESAEVAVVTIGITDVSSVKMLLKRLNRQAGAQMQEDPGDANLVTLGDSLLKFTPQRLYILITSAPAAQRKGLLDDYLKRLEKPLSADGDFQDAMRPIPADAQLQAYVSGAAVTENSDAPAREMLRHVRGYAGGLDIIAENPQSVLHLLFDSDAPALELLKPGRFPLDLLKQMPAPAAAYSINVTNPKRLMRMLNDDDEIAEMNQRVQDELGMNFDAIMEVIGDVGVVGGMWPGEDMETPDLLACQRTPNAEAAAEILKRLSEDENLQSQTIAGQTFQVDEDGVAHGVANDLILLGTPEKIEQMLQPGNTTWQPRIRGDELFAVELDAVTWTDWAKKQDPTMAKDEKMGMDLMGELLGRPLLRLVREGDGIVLRESNDGGKLGTMLPVIFGGLALGVQNAMQPDESPAKLEEGPLPPPEELTPAPPFGGPGLN